MELLSAPTSWLLSLLQFEQLEQVAGVRQRVLGEYEYKNQSYNSKNTVTFL